ncbi:MAG: ABC transporter substrate-binding protein [Actinobacteria bacterium]|nr:ABC transporter substrate-binding protein [Actinomycetota bacterium]
MKKKSKMYRFGCLLITILLAAVAVMGCGGGGDKEKSGATELRVSHQPEFETFQSYQAIQEGLDKKAGIAMKLVYFDSGMPQIEALPANQWDVGATGGVPMLMAALRYNAYMIGLANDESQANVVMVRPDSPILKTKGANPKYPEVYGSANDVKGKTIIVTTVSSGHYALSAYLKALGLTDKDVKIQNMEQAQAVAAFESGKGDIAVLWTPFAYTGLKKGWKVAASSDQVGAGVPLVLLANKKFADEHPDQVVKFLDVYFQSIDKMKKEQANLAEPYQKFLKDWAAIDITKEDAAMDIKWHPVYDLKEELAMFDNSKGQSEMEKTMGGIAEFFTEQGKFTSEEKEKVMKSGFITDKFLKMLAKEKGLIQ